jgi:hypothetical protein
MKKLVLHIASALLMVMAMLACNSDDTSKNPDGTSKQPDSAARSTTAATTFNWDSLAPRMDPVDFTTANMIYDNYRDRIKSKIENRPGGGQDNDIPAGGQQTKHVWLAYSRLRALLDALEQAAGVDPSQLGVRIYLGSYPANYTDAAARRKMTVVLCGTRKEGGYNRDFTINTGDTTLLFAITSYYNHGHLCPPETNCPGAILDEQ